MSEESRLARLEQSLARIEAKLDRLLTGATPTHSGHRVDQSGRRHVPGTGYLDRPPLSADALAVIEELDRRDSDTQQEGST